MARRPQSSSSFNYTWTYDVFISFRGADTRTGFTGNLYKALTDKGIHTFIDDEELRKGEQIAPTLVNAIQDSRIAIIVFSKNYAYSTFCLEELVKILECIKQQGRLVWPVFYDIDPSIVRHQREGYGEALAKHAERFRHDKQKVKKWKLALCEASNLSGWHLKQGCEYQYQFIERIVKEVSRKVNRTLIHIANFPVGLESRVKKVISLLDVESNEGVNMVGIYGIPGIGKTTIARAVCNLIADNFEGVCFLADVKFNTFKHGLVNLQEILLSEILGEKDIKLHDVSQGIPIIKRRLHRKKVLIIVDNVDKLEQLEAIVGKHDWFGSGSRIIITTRNKHLLNVHGVVRQYEAELLSHEDAFRLFLWSALRRSNEEVDPRYEDVSIRVVRFCSGLPLALEIIGCNLFNKSPDEWDYALETYKRIPHQNIQDILKASYDGLGGNEKEIFLDIACFFKGHLLRDVINILLNGRSFQPEYSIGVLIEKSLVKIEGGFVRMHDLIEDMGKEIVRQESPLEPGKRSRLWFYEDILHVLEEDTGTNEIEVIVLRMFEDKEVRLKGKALKKMKNLKILIIEKGHFPRAPKHLPNSLRVLDWREYPSSSLPSNFHPDKLGILKLSRSCFILNEQLKNFRSLNEMELSCCQFLKRVPDISGMPNLTKLNLSGCRKLIEVDDSVGFLGKLKFLNASRCPELRIFPNAIKSTYLEDLNLSNCPSLKSFPEALGVMENIEDICWDRYGRRLALRGHRLLCGSLVVPKIGKLIKRFACLSKCEARDQERVISIVSSKLRSLAFQDCPWIDKYLSAWLGFFPDFKELHLSWSNVTDEYLVKGLPWFPNLELLDLSDTCITIVPECIMECHFLTTLYLNDCRQLQEIRGVPPNIQILSAERCTSLSARSTSILMSETLLERRGRCFKLPGVIIPEWFDHSTWGSSLSFWFRNKLPEIALCFVNHRAIEDTFHVFINGMQQAIPFFEGSKPEVLPAFRNISLLNLQGKCKWGNEGGGEFMQDAWNHVEIRTVCSTSYPEFLPFPRHVDSDKSTEIALYIYKEKTSTEDIRLTNPNLTKNRYPELRKPKQPERSPL